MASRLINVAWGTVLALCCTTVAWAQEATQLSGSVVDSLSGEPVRQAVILIEELRRQAVSGADGRFVVEGVPAGAYHVSVRVSGYSARRTEIVIGDAPATLELRIDRELHFQEVVTVSPDARSQFEAYQPTSVLGGADLARELEASLGATLDDQPGVASRSLGPASARPVIRGLDGDRVLILQDGQRMGDLSSQSGDHGVVTNPAAAQRVEVVRGPATLLYGASAIGGLVNVISDLVPTRPVMGAHGTFMFDLGSAATETGAAGSVQVGNGRVAMTMSGAGRRSGDVSTPEGEIGNTQSRNGMAEVGVAWTGGRAFFGGSYGYDDTRYGIPVIEGGVLELTPRRHAFSLRGGARELNGLFDEFRSSLAVRRYRHDELEGGEVGTAFRNNTTEVELLGAHRAVGRLKGSIGGWILDRRFDAQGDEALSPAVDQQSVAAFVYEEVTWPHVTVQFGGRVDHARYQPAGEIERTFTTPSGSLGLLLRPAAANDRLTVAASVARASRAPALEELFFYGLHHGNFAIELGNPDLDPEQALGVDLSFRWRGRRASGEVTYFRNDIDNFIYRNPLDEQEFDARSAEFAARFPGRELAGHHDGGSDAHPDEELAIVDFTGADAVLQGVEAHADFQIVTGLFAEGGIDYVRGSLKDADAELPRMPPLRLRGGLRYQSGGFQVGGQVTGTQRQERVAVNETPTDGYALLRLFASYSFQAGLSVNTVTARLDNATDRLYRNHLSLIKEQVPEMGRNFKLLWNVTF